MPSVVHNYTLICFRFFITFVIIMISVLPQTLALHDENNIEEPLTFCARNFTFTQLNSQFHWQCPALAEADIYSRHLQVREHSVGFFSRGYVHYF